MASTEKIITLLKKNDNNKGVHLALVGTCDSKLEELVLLKRCLVECGCSQVTIIDVGRTRVEHVDIVISQDIVAGYSGRKSAEEISSLPRGEVITYMSHGLTQLLLEIWQPAGLHGIVSAGGSGGSSLVAPAMRALPIGFPKLLVSTVASGDTGPLVGETDITMMYSVVDIAGTNSLLRTIFSNAAGAIVGMANAYLMRTPTGEQDVTRKKTKVGITMFGVTTPCVNACRQYLETAHNCEVFVFHATGHGGMAMERLIETEELDAVLDVTTTEICDYLMGGNMSAGPSRLEAALKRGIPCVLSLGATSMVNFGPKATVPLKYGERKLYEHNPTVTLMRTNAAECEQIGQFIVDKVAKFSKDPHKVQIVLPMGGVCMISTPNAPFADVEADKSLFDTIKLGLSETTVKVIEDTRAINDDSFAKDISDRLAGLF